ncbi:hypothetical protein [Brevundimonas sp.]|jgi:hypothetical protein|uniref:hypothetical protein n=1 Tax=Brevundimonas sp. TaxID=1871086 RepID=UPI0037BFF360
MIKVAPADLDRVFHETTYEGLTWLSSRVCATEAFDTSDPTYGLSQPIFVLVEGLAWFAQSIRSGSATYFEATPIERQKLMVRALEEEGAPDPFAVKYMLGVTGWRDTTKAAELDSWIDLNDEANTVYLWRLARAHRQEIEALAL